MKSLMIPTLILRKKSKQFIVSYPRPEESAKQREHTTVIFQRFPNDNFYICEFYVTSITNESFFRKI